MQSSITSKIKMSEIYALRGLMRVLSVFPIKQNRIIINSYRGQQYSCSPKYISEWLVSHYKGQFEIIWAVNEPEKFRFLEKDGVQLVKFNSLKRFFYEATAKISINNIGSYSWIPTRHGQEHINTWHGAVDYKKVALLEINNDEVMKKTLLMTAKETTLYLSANKFFSEYCIPTEFGYYGKILEYGLPRNDELVLGENDDIRGKICEQYAIPEENIILLYAPTWRYDVSNEIPPLDFQEVIDAVEKRFGKKCSLIYRAHHITGSKGTELPNVIDVTDYPDSQEIMAASDLMITDYSSMIWDFSLTGRPCFLFTPDLEDYISKRGFNIPIKEWGFPLCESNDELVNEILGFDEAKYKSIVEYHHNMVTSYETGHARDEVCKWIYERCFGTKA